MKYNGPALFSYKSHFLEKCPVVALDEVEVAVTILYYIVNI